MDETQKINEEELAYLEKTLRVIKNELSKEEVLLQERLKSLVTSGKQMWEDNNHYVDDFEKLVDLNQYLSQFTSDTTHYNITKKKIDRLKILRDSPYFGRFDFKEEGYDDVEKIYIGRSNLTDSKTTEIVIYDWRAPVSSMFYSSESGKGEYKSPVGKIEGDILLKRQYKIVSGKMQYFFDSNIRINDEILQEMLGKNASSKMRSIVETIQKEQDVIIRDTENELLIVQGVAGSGKTSIALHRVAFLLYEGLNYKLKTNNIIIISPNSTFSNYISNVLPELGEENVEQATFEEIFIQYLQSGLRYEARNEQLENLVSKQDSDSTKLKQKAIEFKGSVEFVKILDRFIDYYEKKFVKFKDIYYHRKIIEKSELLKSFFLNNKIKMPMARRLERIENIILSKIEPMQKDRLAQILNVVDKCENHPFDKEEFSRFLSIKEAKALKEYIRSFTVVDYMNLYYLLFKDEELFIKMTKGLNIPDEIRDIIKKTFNNIENGYFEYEDCAPLLYLKLRIEGNEKFKEVRQTVIDEAQDYYPIHYHIFKLLFKDARFTILGDFNQSLEKNEEYGMYENVEMILDKKKSIKLRIKKSYRSSYEINNFTKKILSGKQEVISFERHEEEPRIFQHDSLDSINDSIIIDANNLRDQGYESIAIICKTMEEAQDIYERLKDRIKVKIIDDRDGDFKKSIMIMPSYQSKGLEFDAVLIYNASKDNYKTEFDRRMFYVACTRALHRLYIYYKGEKSTLV